MTGYVAMPGSMGPWTGGTFPGAQCVLAGNPGPMTLDGTNTWLIEADEQSVVLIDPGPDDLEHLDAVRAAIGDRWVRDIVLTHGHLDHSAGARTFAAALSARVRAVDPTHRLGDEGLPAGAVLACGDIEIHVVATPGHSSDSVSLYLPHSAAVLTGDTILGRGTTVVAFPDGRLADYLASLYRLQELVEGRDATQVWPGHGPVLEDAAAVLDAYLRHRHERLEEVRQTVAALDPQTPVDDVARSVVETVYADVPQAVWPAAELSVRAQLEYLRDHG